MKLLFLSEHLPLISLIIGVVLLLFLNIKLKINSILALIFSAIVVGFINGMKPVAILETIKEGLGSTLGSLALIIGFGAVLGKLMVDSGAAQRIASTLINKFGAKHVQWALIIVGAVFGISVFYEVAFMILAPLVISIAVEAKTPFMKLAITMVAATTLSHSIFPPQAGPTVLVDAYNADMGMVYILGIIVFIPSVFMAGIVLPKFMKNMDYPVPPLLKKNKVFSESEMPSFGMSLFIPLIPAILISISTILSLFITEDTLLHETVTFLGSAEISLIIAILNAIAIFGLRKGKNMDDMMKTFESGLKGVATIIFIEIGRAHV